MAAQDRTAEPELEDLIPDAAVDNPEGWAGATSTPEAAAPIGEIDPSSPLAELPGLSVPWPDETFELPALVGLEPDPDIAQELAQVEDIAPEQRLQGVEQKVSDRLTLAYPTNPEAFPERDAFQDRFKALSAVETLDDGDDTLPQLAARARADRELLLRLLRIYGYYDGEVYQSVGGIEPGAEEPKAGDAFVRFDVVPGARYRFGTIELGDLPATGGDYPLLRGSYEIARGDPLYTDKIVEERADLDIALGENGYAFAKVGEPDLLVDHRREEGDINQPVASGGKYRFGPVVSNLPRFLSSKHLQTIARFDPGDLYKRSDAEDLRRAVLATGLVSSVLVKPREVAPPANGDLGTVAMDVEMTPAPLRTIAGAIGYGTGEGFRAEASWEHRNFWPPEGMLRVRAIAGTQEQLAGVTLRFNNFKGRDQVLTFDAYANTVDRKAFEGRTIAVTGSFEKLTTLIFQKPWTWSVGFEAIATQEQESDAEGVEFPRETYFIGALPLRVAFDGSDDLLDPTRGFRAALRVSPELSVQAGNKSVYARVQADASYYQPFGDKVVLAARTRVGSIPGTDLANIAPSRRFYAGGGGSVRGYGYQEIGPRDKLGDPSGGRSLVEFSLEARVNTGFFDGNLQVVPFVDAGAVDESATPRFNDIRIGAGIGLRYKTGFGPVRIDVGVPLNKREGDAPVGVYVALGQAF